MKHISECVSEFLATLLPADGHDDMTALAAAVGVLREPCPDCAPGTLFDEAVLTQAWAGLCVVASCPTCGDTGWTVNGGVL